MHAPKVKGRSERDGEPPFCGSGATGPLHNHTRACHAWEGPCALCVAARDCAPVRPSWRGRAWAARKAREERLKAERKQGLQQRAATKAARRLACCGHKHMACGWAREWKAAPQRPGVECWLRCKGDKSKAPTCVPLKRPAAASWKVLLESPASRLERSKQGNTRAISGQQPQSQRGSFDCKAHESMHRL